MLPQRACRRRLPDWVILTTCRFTGSCRSSWSSSESSPWSSKVWYSPFDFSFSSTRDRFSSTRDIKDEFTSSRVDWTGTTGRLEVYLRSAPSPSAVSDTWSLRRRTMWMNRRSSSYRPSFPSRSKFSETSANNASHLLIISKSWG